MTDRGAPEKKVRKNIYTTRTVTLAEVPAAFDELLQPNGHCKVMIRP